MPRKSSIFGAADDLLIVQTWNAGMSSAQIARMVGRSYVATRYRITQLVLDGVIARDRGERFEDARRYHWPTRTSKNSPKVR